MSTTENAKKSHHTKLPVNLKVAKKEKVLPLEEIADKHEKTQEKEVKIEKKPKKDNRKLFLLILLPMLILAIVLTGVYLLFFNKKSSEKKTESKSVSFTLIRESGEVEYKKPNDSYQSLKNDEIDLPNKSFVKTGVGQAHVIFPNNSMLSIDKDSEIEIVLDNQNTLINQLSGNTWNRVKSLTSNESYRVETPTALATVRGTKFGVELGKNPKQISGIYLVESKIDVDQKNSQSKMALKPGQYMEIKPNADPDSFKDGELLPEELQGRWYKRNRLIDSRFDSVDRMTAGIMKQMGAGEEMQAIDKGTMGTRKTDCRELLDQEEVQKSQQSSLKINKPNNGAEYLTTDTIETSLESFDACKQKPIQDLKWYLDDSKTTFSTTDSGKLNNLSEGTHKITAKGKASDKELSDEVIIKVIAPTTNNEEPKKPVTRPQPTPQPINQSPVAKITPLKYTTYNSTTPSKVTRKCNPKIIVACIYIYELNLNLTGTGTDPEDGNLSGNSLIWYVDGVEQPTKGNNLTHTFQTNTVPKNFTITLKATDSKGLSNSDSVVITVKYP